MKRIEFYINYKGGGNRCMRITKDELKKLIDETPEENLEMVYSYLIKATKRSPMRTLHSLLNGITEENRHEEQITDRQGKELI